MLISSENDNGQATSTRDAEELAELWIKKTYLCKSSEGKQRREGRVHEVHDVADRCRYITDTDDCSVIMWAINVLLLSPFSNGL